MQRYCKTDNDIIRTSYEISKLIAKKLKSQTEGESVKACFLTAAKLLVSDKVKLFQKVSLSRRTISDRIREMGDDIEIILKDKFQSFNFFAQAFDEGTDITDTVQLAMFIQGIISDFKVQEDLL